MTTISDKAALALKECIATKGKNKGMLLAKCPPMNTLSAAAWQGAMLSINPYKVGIATLMFMSDEQRAVCDEVTKALDGLPHPMRIALQRDRKILEGLGVW